MILLDQLNCMTLLAVVCLDWKLTAGGRRWKRWPGVSSKLQNSSPDPSHLWNCRSLDTSLIKVFCLFESVTFFFLQCCWLVRDSSCFEVAGLSSAVVKFQGKNNGGEVIVSWVHVDQRRVFACQGTCSSFSPEEKSRFTWEAACINMPKYILTNAFGVPVRIESSSWDGGQLSAADLRGVYEQINLCRLSIC